MKKHIAISAPNSKPHSFHVPIDRRRFGMTAFPLVVGNKVKLTIRARMVPG